MIDLDELESGMVIGVVRGGPQAGNNVQLPAARPNRSESVPRWFNAMDRNADGGISWREFLGTKAQFEELDRDSDGFVDAMEVETSSE